MWQGLMEEESCCFMMVKKQREDGAKSPSRTIPQSLNLLIGPTHLNDLLLSSSTTANTPLVDILVLHNSTIQKIFEKLNRIG